MYMWQLLTLFLSYQPFIELLQATQANVIEFIMKKTHAIVVPVRDYVIIIL